jgi:hypothetical protein
VVQRDRLVSAGVVVVRGDTGFVSLIQLLLFEWFVAPEEISKCLNPPEEECE